MNDKANSKFDLKIKEALHFNWRKTNSQQNHLVILPLKSIYASL